MKTYVDKVLKRNGVGTKHYAAATDEILREITKDPEKNTVWIICSSENKLSETQTAEIVK